jgi:3-oxoacyl-[acyl-carrier-protein] synthase-1
VLEPVAITAYTATCAVGPGREALVRALRERRSGLRPCGVDFFPGAPRFDTWVGEVRGLDEVQLPAELAEFDCRNQRIAWLALQQDGFLDAARAAVRRHGAHRVGVFVGTSTSGILQAELAYRERAADGTLPAWFNYRTTLNNGSGPAFLGAATGARGPTFAVSTACSSSAKVFGVAARMLRVGLIDAAIVGGADSLCMTTLCGFASLELLSPGPCRPFDRERNGISIGEGAGFALLERGAQSAVALLGCGESSDAHHMSSPHPEGLGAESAMRGALDAAGLAPGDVGYVNLHGTATRANDPSEGRAVARVFGAGTPTSSTKAWFGHLLGAAGIVEAVVTLLAIEEAFLPGTLNSAEADPECPNRLLLENEDIAVDAALTNSFGFGGTNCSLLFGRA